MIVCFLAIAGDKPHFISSINTVFLPSAIDHAICRNLYSLHIHVRAALLNSCIYRHGAPTGALAGSKLDGTSQQNNIVSRIQSKTDVDYATQPNERRERHAGVDKERTTVKGNR